MAVSVCVRFYVLVFGWVALTAWPSESGPIPDPVKQPQDEKIPASKPLPPAYFAELADLKRRYELWDEAGELYRKAIGLAKTEEERANFRMSLAEMLDSSGKPEEALKEWSALAQAQNPVLVFRAKLALAQNLAASGKEAQAIEELEALALRCPIANYRAVAAQRLAVLVRKAVKPDHLNQYRAGLKKEPGNRELLALVLWIQKDDPAAQMETLADVYRADPKDLEIRQQYGASLLEAGRLDEAQAVYRALRDEVPTLNRLACEQLAKVSTRKGAFPEAEQWIEQSATGMPEDIERSLYLARQALSLERFGMAEKYGRQAHERAKGEALTAAANMEWGEALFHLHRREEALKLLKPIAVQSLWHGLKVRAQALVQKASEPERP